MSRLHSFLQRHWRIGIDPCVFIYQLQANPRYVEGADAVFRWLESAHTTAVTSTLTMAGLLVVPHRNRDDGQLIAMYRLL